MAKIENRMLKQAIIVVVVLIVIIGDLIYYKMKDPYKVKNPDDIDTGEIVLTNMDPGALQALEVVDNTDDNVKIVMNFEDVGGELRLAKRQVLYKTDNHENDLDDGKKMTDSGVNMLKCTVTSLKALRILEENATDVNEYGMDDPTCSIKMVLKNGETKLLKFGKRLPTTPNAYYFMMDDDNKIYVVSKGDLRSILSPDDFIVNVGG